MKYYIINEKRLLELLKEENQLNALECAGVDNWPGYWEAKDCTDKRFLGFKNEFNKKYNEFKIPFNLLAFKNF